MTALGDAPGELADALEAGGIATSLGAAGLEPPGAVIYANGIPDLRGIGRTGIRASWRATLLASSWDSAGAAAELNALRATTLGILVGLDGWQIDEVGPDAIVPIAGADLLGCDVIASRLVTV